MCGNINYIKPYSKKKFSGEKDTWQQRKKIPKYNCVSPLQDLLT